MGGGMSYIQNLAPNEVIQGVFTLDILFYLVNVPIYVKISKIYLKNDYPIIIRYNVANRRS